MNSGNKARKTWNAMAASWEAHDNLRRRNDRVRHEARPEFFDSAPQRDQVRRESDPFDRTLVQVSEGRL